jgi:hypothetical protein
MPKNLLNLYFILITRNDHSKQYIYDEIQNYNGSKLLTSSNLISSNTQNFKILKYPSHPFLIYN